LHKLVPFDQLFDLHIEQMKQFPGRWLDPKTGKEVKGRKAVANRALSQATASGADALGLGAIRRYYPHA
jgi:hypothetical protein